MFEAFRQLFSKKVYSIGPERTTATRLLSGLYACIFIGIVSLSLLDSQTSVIPVLILLVICFSAARFALGSTRGRKILNARSYVGHHTAAGSQLGASVLMYEIDDAKYQTDIVTRGTGWETYDVTYVRSKSTRNELRCYTVFEAPLVRVTPHLVFDAKRSRGRQFRTYYLDEQKLSFEGEFDSFFDVYAPEHYEIDTLTFISPEVMEAFMELSEYDVELLHGRLLVYGPLLPDQELIAFQAFCQELAKQLNDNLSRYRDSYLPSRAATKHTMPFARLLLENPWKHWVDLLGTTIVLLVLLTIAVVTPNGQVMTPIVVFSFLVWIPFITKVILTLRRNRRLKKSFYTDLSAIQSRGRY